VQAQEAIIKQDHTNGIGFHMLCISVNSFSDMRQQLLQHMYFLVHMCVTAVTIVCKPYFSKSCKIIMCTQILEIFEIRVLNVCCNIVWGHNDGGTTFTVGKTGAFQHVKLAEVVGDMMSVSKYNNAQ
jgi:hypothetical protein